MKLYYPNKQQQKQRGAALITALVCLIMVSLMGVIAVRTANTNAKVASNAKQSLQSSYLANSAMAAFFINTQQTWNLVTTQGNINVLAPVNVGNAQVGLQVEHVTTTTCPIEAGTNAASGNQCVYLKASSYHRNAVGGETIVNAGFYAPAQQSGQ